MRFAYSIYWGGTIVDATTCDYESSRKLGLHCPFCNEALFLKTAHTRTMPDGSRQQVAAAFAHYPGHGLDCELRAKRPEGEHYIKKLEIQSRNQRLILFNKHFIDIVRHHIHIDNERDKVKAIRKILGKDFTKPFVKQFLTKKITWEFIQKEAAQNLERIKTNSTYLGIPEILKDELGNIAQKIHSYMNYKNLVVAHEIALWLQSKSASWALERLVLFSFICQCESVAIMKGEDNSLSSVRKYAKKNLECATQYSDIFMSLIFSMFISINWQYIGFRDGQ